MVWSQEMKDDVARSNAISALRAYDLIAAKDGVITVTAEGRQYVTWRNQMIGAMLAAEPAQTNNALAEALRRT